MSLRKKFAVKRGDAPAFEPFPPFRPDFSKIKAPRAGQPLVKAIGWKGWPFSVLDITGGWGADAFMMALLGCRVTALESHPVVFQLVQTALAQLPERPRNLKFLLADSLNYMKTVKTPLPDVIYMDPMFGESKKSLSRKDLKTLKELTGPTKQKQALFDLARRKTARRLIVKRHRREASLGPNRLCVFKGRSVCYDVFGPA